tara:strand:+ start:812 stop:1120 length:309 start_codon:yes stop_codon:yes gene_type:complete
MSRHTPGPWEITKGVYGDTLVTSTHEKYGIDDDVCLVYGGNDNEPRAKMANAQLISAAPELDAYRQYIEDNFERIERGGWTPVCFDEFKESEECANYMTEEA